MPEARFRADPATYVLFGIMLGLPAILVLASTWGTNSWDAAWLSIAPVACFMYWLSRFEIRLSPQGLTYRSARGSRQVGWSQIRSSELQVGEQKYTDRFKPTVRLVVRLSGSGDDRPLIMNLKPFRRADVQRLLKTPELRLVKDHDVA